MSIMKRKTGEKIRRAMGNAMIDFLLRDGVAMQRR